MLDYAANGTEYWTMDRLRQSAAETATLKGFTLDEQIEALLDERDVDIEAYWEQVEQNLREGYIRLIFVADEIHRELRRLVEFLNSKMSDVEVLAVEIKQYLGQGQKAMVPRVIGMTEASRGTKPGGAKRKWDEDSFFADLAARANKDEVEVARDILQWSRSKATYVWWGEGVHRGSFVPVLKYKETKNQLFAVWSSSSIEFYFQWYQSKKPFDAEAKRIELLNRLNEIPGIDLEEDVITRRPWIPLSVFVEPENLRRLFEIFEWFISEIEAI
jgi:hypothetical protein